MKGYIVVIQLRTATKVLDSHHYELPEGQVSFASLADLKSTALGDMAREQANDEDAMFAHISGIYPVSG